MADDNNPQPFDESPEAQQSEHQGDVVNGSEATPNEQLQEDQPQTETGEPAPITGVQAPESQPESTPADLQPKPKKRISRKTLYYMSFAIINITLLAASIYVMRAPIKHVQSAALPAQKASVTTSSVQETTATATKAAAEAVRSVHYVSDALKLEFDYPSDWRISSNPGNTYMTIQSAPFDTNKANGTTGKARAEITIYAKFPETTNDIADNSVISTDSEKLVYKSPTKVQRTETNLSLSRENSVSQSGVVTAGFVSSDLVYKTNQLVGSKNYRKTNPFIIFKIRGCDDLCDQVDDFTPIAVDTFKQLTAYTTAKDIISSMRFN